MGGVVPFVGKAVEQKMRGQEVKFDVKEELINCGVNAAGALLNVGAIQAVGALGEAGKIGVWGARAIGGAAGFAVGAGKAVVLQKVHERKVRKEMAEQGYSLVRNERNSKDGRNYAVYRKKGGDDVYVPCGDLGDVFAAGLMEGFAMVFAANRKYRKAEKVYR